MLISMIAGKIIPTAERQNAPTRDMNKPRYGTTAARSTEKTNITKYILYIEEKCDFFGMTTNLIL